MSNPNIDNVADNLKNLFQDKGLVSVPAKTVDDAISVTSGAQVDRPELMLPSDRGVDFDITYEGTANAAFSALKTTHTLYRMGSVAVRLVDGTLQPVESRSFKALIDANFSTTAYQAGRNGKNVIAPKLISEEVAGTMLKTEAVRTLINVGLISLSPIITDPGIVTFGVHNGVLVMGGAIETVELLQEAVTIIENLQFDFDFLTPADKSRAIAMLITPALKFGGLLRCRCPIFIVEANMSQAGKGLLTELTATTYYAKIATVTARDGGVGGLDESLDMAMVSGSPFIRLDNVRGRVQSQRLESLLTESGTIQARIPHVGYVEVRPSAHIWQFTANGAEATQDLMNRSSIVTIRKRPDDYQFKSWDGLGIMGWTEKHQAKILGAIFRIIQERINAGKPSLPCPSHDFREWAGVVAWFCQTIFHLPPPSEGHRQAAAQRADPVKAWLHALGGKMLAIGAPIWMTTQELLDASNRHELEAPNSDLGTLGRLLGKCFDNGTCLLDGMEWRRQELQAVRPSGQPFFQKRYCVFRHNNTVNTVNMVVP